MSACLKKHLPCRLSVKDVCAFYCEAQGEFTELLGNSVGLSNYIHLELS